MTKHNEENPKQFLCRLLNKRVRLFLKWGQHYEGLLVEYDKYFNFVLDDVKEIDNDNTTDLGRTFFRCNNVKIIQEVEEQKNTEQ